jgi:hypothetical protein
MRFSALAAFDLLRGAAMREPIDDPDLRRRVTTYLAEQQDITIRFHQARTSEDRDAALNDLITHADTHRRLIDEVIKYQADHGNLAKPPRGFGPGDNSPAPPAKATKRTRECVEVRGVV